MRKVFFVVKDRYWGSALLRGFQISQQLKRYGIPARTLNLSHDLKKVRGIKDSILFLIKDTIFKSEEFSTSLENNNTVIWDALDFFVMPAVKREASCRSLKYPFKRFDGVIFPSLLCQQDWQGLFKADCVTEVIHPHWDTRLKRNRAKNFGLIYIGMRNEENIRAQYFEQIKPLHFYDVRQLRGRFKLEDGLSVILKYNCHFSVRDENGDAFKYKPGTKLSFASGTCSNIILSREPSHLELLDRSYPYYTDNALESVKQTVAMAQETFKTRTWDKALDMMLALRQRTSIKRIADDYMRFLRNFT